jgi:acyl-CoA synthetase (AMP-forming)/AMP-acid ligase II
MNGPPPNLPRLVDYVDWYARNTPHALAVSGHGERLSYAELSKRVRECAAALAGRGVGRGDRVATLTTPGGAFVVTFLATSLVGAIWIGLNPRHTPAELDATIGALDPRLVFVRDSVEGKRYDAWTATLSGRAGVVALADGTANSLSHFAAGKRVEPEILSAMEDLADPDEPCLIVFTSGSSGKPKGVMISQRALVGASLVQRAQWPASPLRVLNNLPINHIGCVGDLFCFALIGGGTTVFSERFDPADTMALLRSERATVLGQVPTQFILTLDSPAFDANALASLQLIFWGGAAASRDLIARLERFGKAVATSYGQTETVGSVTFTPADADTDALATTVGRAVAPYRLRIVDESDQVVSQGEPGEIQIHSPFRMNGYWRNPEATARAITDDGWLRTGDIGLLAADGALSLIGRTTDTFKSGGYNIYPAEIEAAIASYPNVAEVAVVAVADPIFGAVGMAMVSGRPSASLTDAALRAHLGERLANYKIPKRIVISESLPKLPVGKIDKNAVREMLAAKVSRQKC